MLITIISDITNIRERESPHKDFGMEKNLDDVNKSNPRTSSVCIRMLFIIFLVIKGGWIQIW